MSEFSFSSHRSPVYAKRGIVAASQPLAVAAGLEIMSKGGNAADAAIATAAALNVTEPTSTGIGGDCFALYFEAKTAKVYALNGSGRAPKKLSLDRLKREGYTDQLPPYHPYTITVPGACAGWFDLIERFGNLSMEKILSPAIRLATEGFPVAPITAYFWQRGAQNQLTKAAGGHELTIGGRGPSAGEMFRNPGLAKTFTYIAESGKAGFYQGKISEAIAQVVQSSGGCLTLEDLAAHESTWEEPIFTSYQGVNIWECPPNGQGLTALLALNILESFNIAKLQPMSAKRLHLMIEALRLAFADTRWFIADPKFSSVPVTELLSKAYAQERSKKINPNQAVVDQKRGSPTTQSNTVYLSVIDGEGNACSFINSNYMGFGTGIVPQGWGFSLQNRGHNFSLKPEHPNHLEPGKRPYHTIIPAMATETVQDSTSADGIREQLYASFGVMGGFMQPQGHVQVVVNLVEDRLDPQQALDRPRFCIEDGTSGGKVAIEDGISSKTRSKLEEMGHQIIRTTGHNRALFGRGQIIQRNANSGILCAGSDPRADGCAMTW